GGGGGPALVTGSPGGARFCVARLDALDRLCDLVYYGTDSVEARNLCTLVGQHQSYLGGLVAAHEAGLVPCLIENLRQPRFDALYHDRFGWMRDELRAALAGGDAAAPALLAALDRGMTEGEGDAWAAVAIRKAVGSGGAALPPSTRATLEMWAAEFLKKNKATLADLVPPAAAAAAEVARGPAG
ncbi:unnamed protein product, partial [Phaeothamnion confervicola]